MDGALQNIFRTQLKSLTGFNFQNIVIKIFLMKYGETDFTPIRCKKDKGCDGIVESEKRVIACFGPDITQNTQKRHKDFKGKVNSDFNLYKTHWQSHYPNWTVIVNQDIDPQYDKIVKELSPTCSVIGVEQLLSMIENLKNHQKRLLGEEFRIETEYFSNDYLKVFIEDLLKESDTSNDPITYERKSLLAVRQKIELNYDFSEIQDAIKEYELLSEEGCLNSVDVLMSGYEDDIIKKLKNRILGDYSNLTAGSFKTRLKILSEHYLAKYSSTNDDDYLLYIRAVLITLFEQCLIGAKTKQI